MGILGAYCFARLVESWLETKSVSQTLKRVAHLIGVGIATLLLLNLNPYGWEYAPYLIRAIHMDRPLILEWQPIWEIKSPLLFIISVLVAACAVYFRRKGSLFEAFALALTAYLAAKHYRHGSLYAVTWACLVPGLIETTKFGDVARQLWKKQSAFISVASLALAIVAIGYSVNVRFWELRIPSEQPAPMSRKGMFPVGPVDYLKENQFEGNLFVPFSNGAFVQWKLYPQVKVSIDSRYEVAYPPGALEESLYFYMAKKGWQETLAKYDTNALLIPNGCNLAEELEKDNYALAAEIEWKCVYRDRGYSLYFPNASAGKYPFVDNRQTKVIGVFP